MSTNFNSIVFLHPYCWPVMNPEESFETNPATFDLFRADRRRQGRYSLSQPEDIVLSTQSRRLAATVRKHNIERSLYRSGYSSLALGAMLSRFACSLGRRTWPEMLLEILFGFCAGGHSPNQRPRPLSFRRRGYDRGRHSGKGAKVSREAIEVLPSWSLLATSSPVIQLRR